MESTATGDALSAGRFIEAIDRGEPLLGVLDEFVRAVESSARATAMLPSVLLLEGGRLRCGAAPGLPAEYNAAIDGIAIGPNVGSCGTAAYCGHAIYVADIASDPLWKDFRDLALRHGLRACWSRPIFSAAGRVLGTFALYYREPRSPTEPERQLVQRAAESVGAMIEAARRRDGRASSAPESSRRRS